ncbi:hypothetical protein D9M68_842070 [compost metagenome]
MEAGSGASDSCATAVAHGEARGFATWIVSKVGDWCNTSDAMSSAAATYWRTGGIVDLVACCAVGGCQAVGAA